MDKVLADRVPFKRTHTGAKVSAGRKQVLQGAVRLLPSPENMETAVRTAAAGGRMASAVRGSPAKRKPHRISA